MRHLPEPRRFGGGSVTDELALAAAEAARGDPLERPRRRAALSRALAALLEQDHEPRVRQALHQAPDAAAYRMLTEALAGAIEAASAESGIVARAFALPVVLVASASTEVTLAGVLPDLRPLHALFEHTGALGPTRNFGLSNALGALEALEELSPRNLMRLSRSLEPHALGSLLPPAPIHVRPGHEQTHLRFLLGAALTPPDSPGFLETAAHVGAWGNACAKLLQEQLGAPGLQLAALPRPPRSLVDAAHAGRFAQLEIALNLFASNAVRRFRLAVGDPVAIVSAHDGGEIRISLGSAFADDLQEGFRWPLHPADELAGVEQLILDLLADMRVTDVRVVEHLLPSQRETGVLLHPRLDEWERLAAAH